MASHKQRPVHEPADSAADTAVPTPKAAESESGAELEGSLADQIQKLQAEKQELTSTLLRRQADFENVKKRMEKERQQDRHRGVENLVEQLLPVLDAFDRALAGNTDPANAEYRKGFEILRGQIWNALAKQGVERIESLGKEFDPNLHHAIESVETSDHAEGVIVGELQPGYSFHGRILRPAMVRVAAGAPN